MLLWLILKRWWKFPTINLEQCRKIHRKYMDIVATIETDPVAGPILTVTNRRRPVRRDNNWWPYACNDYERSQYRCIHCQLCRSAIVPRIIMSSVSLWIMDPEPVPAIESLLNFHPNNNFHLPSAKRKNKNKIINKKSDSNLKVISWHLAKLDRTIGFQINFDPILRAKMFAPLLMHNWMSRICEIHFIECCVGRNELKL